MPDFESSTLGKEDERRGNYLEIAVPATPSLQGILEEKIRKNGPLDFADYMACALYHPDLGYYAIEARQVGRDGDFFTSVSVGPLFGNLLARRFLREWQELGEPKRWRILECGAHDGTLAFDVLSALRELAPAAFAALEYVICEPLPRLRDLQAERLKDFSDQVRSIHELETLARNPLPGLVFGNELLDALPFHVVEWRKGKWNTCGVACGVDGKFCWEVGDGVASAQVVEALAPLGGNFADGYRTEVRTGVRDFLEPLTQCISTGLLLWLDYGFAQPEYYDPARSQGTMRTFSKHRAGEDPLSSPGEIDITAHVDFTAVAMAAKELGCVLRAFCRQGAWLTEIGAEWLRAQEGRPDRAKLREFQTLTHPSHLGGCFHVLELGWNLKERKLLAERDLHRLALFTCGGADSQ